MGLICPMGTFCPLGHFFRVTFLSLGLFECASLICMEGTVYMHGFPYVESPYLYEGHCVRYVMHGFPLC